MGSPSIQLDTTRPYVTGLGARYDMSRAIRLLTAAVRRAPERRKYSAASAATVYVVDFDLKCMASPMSVGKLMPVTYPAC